MKNLIKFYLAIFLPLILIVILAVFDIIGPTLFVILLFGYAFIYHPFISGKRLLAIHEINKEDFWKNFIPFWNSKYFVDLFVKNKEKA